MCNYAKNPYMKGELLMSITVQCCGLELMLILLYFYKSQKKISLGTERAYFRLFCMAFASIVLDILSCFAITNHEAIPSWLVSLSCKTYLVSFMGLAGFILQYIGADIFPIHKTYVKMMIIYGSFALVGAAVVYILPIKYFLDDETGELYTYGPSVTATYTIAGIIFFMVFCMIFRSWNKMAKRRRDGILIGIALMFLAAIIQFLNARLLLVGFSFALCTAVLYLKLENPGYNIDSRTGLFNQNALQLYINQAYSNHTEFSVIEIIYFAKADTKLNVDETLNEVMSYLSSVPGTLAFKGVSNEVFILVRNTARSRIILDKLRSRFEAGWGRGHDIKLDTYWVFVPDPYIVADTNELMNTLRYARQHTSSLTETHCFYVDEALAGVIKEEKHITELIEGALVNGKVEVFYQPIYSTKERRFTAAEALVRIRDDEGNIIPPGRFISIAEHNGMILRIGEEVFRQVCAFISTHDLKALGLHYIEVNLSVIQCAYEPLADDYIRIMKENHVSPDMINLEITESASLETKNMLLRNMRKLLDFGVSFSLDDFGTGQSNLNYIIDMPVDIVKFDREMTNAYFENSRAKYIMDAAMNMIHGMNLDIVSEGVENEEQLKTLEKLNISYIQGFYFSKPLPAREFLSFITERNLK